MQSMPYFTELLILVLILIALAIIYYYTKRYRKTTEPESRYIAALEYLADGDSNRAIQLFKETVKEDTENVKAYVRLGDLLREKGLVKNALKIHKDLTLRSGMTLEMRQRVKGSLMLDYEAKGDFSTAASIARELLGQGTTTQKEITQKLISYLERMKQWTAAFEASKRYVKPLSPAVKKKMALYLVFAGLDLKRENEGHSARLKYREALKMDPDCAAAYYYLGKSYSDENRLNEAIKEWKQFCSKMPDHAFIAFPQMERAWFELGKFAEAEKLYQNMLASNPENKAAALALSQIYDKKGDHDRALEILDRIETDESNVLRILGHRFQILFSKGQYKNACNLALEYLRDRKLLSEKTYSCQECQFTSNEPLWMCPQCNSINSYNI